MDYYGRRAAAGKESFYDATRTAVVTFVLSHICFFFYRYDVLNRVTMPSPGRSITAQVTELIFARRGREKHRLLH
jgi:hypothetical protein